MNSTRKQFLVVLLAALLAIGLAARLGWWQLDRAAQKRELQAAIEGRAQQAPLGNADLLATEQQLHRAVRVQGRWLAERTILLDNRPMNGHVGFFVVTPLQLEGRSEAVLVQRGWLPRHAQDRNRLPPLATPAGLVEVRGRLIIAPTRLYELGPSASGPIRQNLAAAAFAQEIGQPLLPLTLLQLGQSEGDDLPRDWPAPDLGLHKHYGYAFQWFALSALFLGLYVWFQIIQPRRRAKA